MVTRVGILGAGNISDTHARAAQEIPGVEVAAVYGTNAEKTSALARRTGAVAHEDLASFLDHRPMDIVAIGSPSGLHAEQATAAVRRGLHVLVEKPLDITAARVDALITESSDAQVQVGVFFQDRLRPDIVRIKKVVSEQRLGTPVLASGRVKWYRPPDYYAKSRWRGTWALDGGGALMNQGIHTVDLLLWLFGPVAHVTARTATRVHKIEVEDTAVALIEFENGALGTLEAATSIYPGFARRLELTGSEGTLILEDDRLTSLALKSSSPDGTGGDAGADPANSSTSPVVADASAHRRVIEDFIDAIRTGRPPACDAREGRKSIELVEAIYRSAREGCAVAVAT
jgi:UDP-N-acetyl-2-amino-2-deoxyglucuronate dehydrogenase